MKELIGKTVTGLFVDKDQSILVFTHPNDEKTVYETYGDCCSETWFTDITGVAALIDSVVLEAEDVELMPSIEDGRTRQECDSFYGVKLKTTKGYVDIVYRNSSNGHYGGCINHIVSSYVYMNNFVSITDDWSA